MTTIAADDETVEATAFSTSLDPYGQLIRVLMPRASYIAIFDRLSTPLWLSDGYDGFDLLHLVEESLNAARIAGREKDDEHRDGISRSWDGDTAYIFILRDGSNLLGAVAISCQDGSSGARSTAFVHGLLRPVLQVLARELSHQQSVCDLRQNLTSRDGDVALLLEASGAAADEQDNDDLEQLLGNCVANLNCAVGALLIPERKIALRCAAEGTFRGTDAEILEKTQKHLLTWVQVQRRTLVLNKTPPNNPLGSLPYRILACPIRHGVQHVMGVLILFKRVGHAEFEARQARIVELLTRRIAYVVQSAYDPTTGLLTRSSFEQRVLAQLAAASSEAEHCVVYADVDRLHVVNENHGMHVGDEVIVTIAEAMRANLGPNVSAARISGDRFALFFLDTSTDDALPMVERVRTAIRDADFNRDGKRVPLSISLGLAPVANTRYPLSHALAAAEVACKAAKDRGRGRIELYHDADRSIVRRYEDVAMLGSLREAIVNDRFRMDAQPIIQIGNAGQPRRFELLLRMIDAAGERVTPDKFLSAAERYQLTTDIDRWVVQYALEVLSSAAPALLRLDAHFAINISGQSLSDEDFIAFLEQRLREYALPPQLLSFEITETAAVASIVRAEQLIRRLQELGHAIALDDFGKGLSSLTYLKSLPVSHLKIDGGLVRDVVGNQRAQAMVTTIVQLARTMNLKTTAECIESEAIQTAVGELGVDFGQGFAIGRPRPVEQVLQDLLRGSSGVVRLSPGRLVG